MSVKIDFFKESFKVHKDKYDYSLVDYKKSSEKVIIICRKHGPFEQRASNHLRGRGCYFCKKSKMYSNEKFIEMSNNIHKNKYLYEKTYYIGSHKDVIITCEEHGDFIQTPTNHLSGKGCGKCATESSRLVIDDFINRSDIIHNFKYNYDKVKYKNGRTKVTIICNEHGIFYQKPANHLQGQGCPSCGDNFGIKENKWLDFLNIKERQYRIDRYIVDGYDPDTNTIYEFNGDFWHGNPNRYINTDMNNVLNKTFAELYKKTLEKEQKLKNLGYNIISIWETDFDKLDL